MTAATAKARALAFVATLRGNVDAWYADRTTYEPFGAANRATWDAIEAAGNQVKARVLALLRGDAEEFEAVRS